MITTRRLARIVLVLVALSFVAACGDDDDDKVSSEEEARSAYLGLDRAIDRAIDLGFAGFNAASSANIPPQMDDGDLSGTMAIEGQVDQGASDNKGMRLDWSLTDYSDGAVMLSDGGTTGGATDDASARGAIYYNTGAGALPYFDIKLRDIPNGTFMGTLMGVVTMNGELSGDVTLNVMLSGEIEENPDTPGGVRRKAGTVHITGTAVSSYGEYMIDTTR